MDIEGTSLVISGISGRFPSANNMDELRYNLEKGADMIDDPDIRRWPHCLWGLPGRAGRIKDLSKFDSEFFGYENQSAHLTDHQLRILYEVVYESILDSGEYLSQHFLTAGILSRNLFIELIESIFHA